MNVQKSIKSAWIDFIVCLICGAYGVHKFREKKIGIGVLYLFTFGLFFFGWLYDCAKLLVIAVCITLQHTKTNDSSSTEEQGEIWNRYNALAKKIALIVVIVFLLFFFIVAACAPNTEPTAIPTTESTTASTTESTTVPTTEPTTEPTTAPTTEPTTAPTTEPTTAPTTEPTTAPTTEPTTAPTTEPTTEPTTDPTTEPPHIHNFSAATCTAPKTCSCGATEGSLADHSWTAATCTAPQKCRTCSAENGSAIGHNYNQGTCLTCGSKDPDYVEITYVLNTYTMKFHKPSCRKLPTDNRKDTTMSREEVIAAGYDACGICHP